MHSGGRSSRRTRKSRSSTRFGPGARSSTARSTSSSIRPRSTSSITRATTGRTASRSSSPPSSTLRIYASTSCSRSARTRSPSSTCSRAGYPTCSATTCAWSTSIAPPDGPRSSSRSARYNELVAEGERVDVEPALVDAVLEQVVTGKVEVGQAGRGTVAVGEAKSGSRPPTCSSSCTGSGTRNGAQGLGHCASRRWFASAARSRSCGITSTKR